MTKETTQPLSINANGTMPVSYDGRYITLDLESVSSQNFWDHISDSLKLVVIDSHGTEQLVELPEIDRATRKIVVRVPDDIGFAHRIQLVMHKEPISEFTIENGTLLATPSHELYQLTVSETRGLSRELNPPDLIPYSRAPRLGYEAKIHNHRTDLHTHVSSQITGAELFELSVDLDETAGKESDYVVYPVELMTKLGVPLEEGQQTYTRPSYGFFPLKEEKLKCEMAAVNLRGEANHYEGVRLSDLTSVQRRRIVAAMTAPEDGTRTFQQVEEQYYRLMTPLTRNSKLTKPLLHKIAENYAAQDIDHAELATSSLLNPDWFEKMVEAVDEIENGTKNANGTRNNDAVRTQDGKIVRMRFLPGIQRKAGPIETLRAVERIKYLNRHPYVWGYDLMGNETNRTSDFHWALSNLAMWARASENTALNPNDGWNFQEDVVGRLHVGETAKNPSNVSDAARIARDYKVRIRTGHAQAENLTKEEWDMIDAMYAQEGTYDEAANEHNPRDWFATEKCPASNVFYRMQPLPHQVVIGRHLRRMHGTYGQDGNGMVHTSPRQMAFDALTAGETLKDIAATRVYEEGYIERHHERETRKTKAFVTLYAKESGQFADANSAFIKAYRAFDPDKEIARKFDDKTPFLIGGASGSSWAKMFEDSDHVSPVQIRQMMKILVRVLNPKTTYFLLGRVQQETEGVTRVINDEIKSYNLAHPSNKFSVKGLYGNVASVDTPTGELAETVNGIELIPGGIDAVPDETVRYQRHHSGKSLLFGGGQFTSEIADGLNDREQGYMPVAVFMPPTSILAQKISPVMKPSKHITGAEDLLTRILRDVGPDKFFKSVNERDGALRDSVAITDQTYCRALLEEVQKEVAAENRKIRKTRQHAYD
jgi:hypothetical protein